MKKIGLVCCVAIMVFLVGCAVKTPVQNQYNLERFSAQKTGKNKKPTSILVSEPEAVAGYESEQMLYVLCCYKLEPFSQNAWVGSPARMLFPLIIQSLQASDFFYSVSSTPYADKADYRLDTQLITLHQNFMTKPSHIDLVVKVVVTKINENKVVASTIIREHVNCPEETPYGGVVAANLATAQFTKKLTDFVVTNIQRHQQEARKKI